MTSIKNQIHNQEVKCISDEMETNINRITTNGNIVVTKRTRLPFLAKKIFSDIIGKKYDMKNANHFNRVKRILEEMNTKIYVSNDLALIKTKQGTTIF